MHDKDNLVTLKKILTTFSHTKEKITQRFRRLAHTGLRSWEIDNSLYLVECT